MTALRRTAAWAVTIAYLIMFRIPSILLALVCIIGAMAGRLLDWYEDTKFFRWVDRKAQEATHWVDPEGGW